MHPRLIEIPFVHVTLWGFGLMMVLGFLTALWLVRCLSRRAGLDPETMSNGTLYSLIVGVIGARAFFVIHHFDQFRGEVLGVFAIWRGGLEFLGGVGPAVGDACHMTRAGLSAAMPVEFCLGNCLAIVSAISHNCPMRAAS